MQQRLWFFLAVIASWVFSDSSWAIEPPKTAPLHLVWETQDVLTTATRREIESLLLQHQHLTGERLFLVIAPSGAAITPEHAPENAKKLFDHWGLETVSRGANALLLVQEPSPEEIELGMHYGSGISFEENTPPQTIMKALSQGVTDPPHWDALGMRLTQEWLLALQSPLAQSLTLTEGSVKPKGPPPSRPRDWTWLGVLLLMALSSSLFYWTYRQIVAQEVLIGTERWLLFGPRLKAQLWLRRLPPHLIRGTPSTSKPEIHEHPETGTARGSRA